MKNAIALSAALTAAVSLGTSAPASAEGEKVRKEKCYGISLAGQNACANIQGTHSCAGLSTTDNDPGEWRLVTAGLCEDLGGFNRTAAKEKVTKMAMAEKS